MKRTLLLDRRVAFALLAIAMAGFAAPAKSIAALVYLSNDARASYPGVAPVRTSALGDTGASRGVRGDRTQGQTFQVFEPLSVDRIFIGYTWQNENLNDTRVRIVEVDDVTVASGYVPGNEVAAVVQFNTGAEPTPAHPNQIYAIELAWDASLSGGSPLVLTPRAGNQGYAIEIVGTLSGQGSSSIALTHRNVSVYDFGRPFEVGHGTLSADTELMIAITATSISTPVAGDFNGDGNVDGADFVIWQTNFPNNTGEATLDMGDANADGNVDGADFVIWQTNFPTIAGSGVTAVPEPGTGLLAMIGMGGAAYVHWRRRRKS